MKKSLFCLLSAFLLGVLPVSANKRSQEYFDRGIDTDSTVVFVPKGTLMTGLSFSYSNFSFDNYKFLIVSGLTASGNSLGIAPHASYFLKDNLSIGARFDYNSHNIAVGGASVSFSDDIGLDISNYNSIGRSYFGSAVMRYYMPIAQSRRFGLFTEVRLSGGYGQSKDYEKKGENKYGTYQEMIQLELGLIPGVCVFVTNDVAFDISVGVLGFDYKAVRQYTNQVYKGTYEKSGANFKINIFNINFGISYFIPVKKK